MRMCPGCTGAVCTIEIYPGRLGTQILWQALPDAATASTEPPSTGLGTLLPASSFQKRDIFPQACVFAMAEHTQHEMSRSLAHMGTALLTLQTDLPGELDAVSWQLRWVERLLPPPRHEECEGLGTSHLARLAHLVEPHPGMRWQGFLWRLPAMLSKELVTRRPLTLLLAVLSSEDEPATNVGIYSLWQRLLPRVFDVAQWDEPRS
ncbi:hypothetical protein Krac_10338 [Ktedonobacter racemifer DSM 44963]|uniref:Uncharacterized protein n=2 Tax=Ktedonobacter racemifer TaxID=363277 RepID=D6TGQ7_KTERA|nr:hypothetical protein Krac_10338 [Ktedonobacter racemifer DSM 44963]